MIFGRIMAYVGSEHGLIRPSIITKLFVGADIIAIIAQAAGGSMLVRQLIVFLLDPASNYFLICRMVIACLRSKQGELF